jgi:hypothetical protein
MLKNSPLSLAKPEIHWGIKKAVLLRVFQTCRNKRNYVVETKVAECFSEPIEDSKFAFDDYSRSARYAKTKNQTEMLISFINIKKS